MPSRPINVKMENQWNEDKLRSSANWLHLTSITFEKIPARIEDSKELDLINLSHCKLPALADVLESFGKLPKLKSVSFFGCRFKGVPEEGAERISSSEGSSIKVSLEMCGFDGAEGEDYDKFSSSCVETLKGHAIVQGTGRFDIKMAPGYEFPEHDQSWKFISKLGSDFVGDAAMRQLGYELASGKAPSNEPLERYFRATSWSNKGIRESATSYLERELPDPFAGSKRKIGSIFLMGKPTYLSLKELKSHADEIGLRIVKDPAKADVAVLMGRPKLELEQAIKAGTTIAMECHLKSYLEGKTDPGMPLGESQSDSLSDLLLSEDEGNVRQGLELAAAASLDGKTIAALVALAYAHPTAAIRKDAKGRVLAQGDAALSAHVSKERRQPGAFSKAKKLMEWFNGFVDAGVDGAKLGLSIFLASAARKKFGVDELEIYLPLLFDENAEAVLDVLAKMTEIKLIVRPDKTLPPHLNKLTACERLTIFGKLSHVPSLEPLVQLPKLELLRLWDQPSNAALDVIARVPALRSLYLDKGVRDLVSLTKIRQIRKLDLLHWTAAHSKKIDLEPLSQLTWLEDLKLPMHCQKWQEPLQAAMPNCKVEA